MKVRMAQAQRIVEYNENELYKLEEAYEYFEKFCETFLVIKILSGDLIPLRPNRPQRRFLKVIMRQWREKGWIKVVIAKARKMGFTTIICAFIFWIMYTNITDKDTREAIAGTHEEQSNSTLIDIMNTFHDNLPNIKTTMNDGTVKTVEMRLKKGIDTQSMLEFPSIGASYETRVASNVKKVGRGATCQMLHVSEIAHIDNANKLAASLLSVVGINVKNTMVFLESTSNGMNNFHYDTFIDAINEEPGNKFLWFFAPWFEDERYVEELPPGFKLTEEEEIEKALYGLTDEQMCWRRSMMAQFKGTPRQRLSLFKQEYPAKWQESFMFSEVDSFIEASYVLAAMERPVYELEEKAIPLIAGYDPSHKGKDGDAFVYRRGIILFGLERLEDFGDDFEARVDFLKEKLDNKILYIDMLFIDAGGGGYELHSRLKKDGYGDRVRYIEFGADADNKKLYKNKKDEMFGRFNDLLIDKHVPLCIDVDEELRADFLKDLTATGYERDINGRPMMESKKSLKKRGVKSTNMTDCSVLTTAHPVKKRDAGGPVQTQAIDDTDIYG